MVIASSLVMSAPQGGKEGIDILICLPSPPLLRPGGKVADVRRVCRAAGSFYAPGAFFGNVEKRNLL